MATITITDGIGLVAELAVRDDSPFARAKGTKFVLPAASLVGDLTAPIDQIAFRKGTFGGAFADPSVLINGAASLAINANVSGALCVAKPADKTLFDDDGVSSPVPIADDECWIGIEIDGTAGGTVSVTANGFGAAVGASTTVSFATYSLVKAARGSFPLLKDCLSRALEGYSITTDAAAVRNQKPGTVNASDISGTVTFTGSYSLPIKVNALASANLPFNYKIDVDPAATLKVSGKIAVSGDFVVRSHKVSESELRFGVYKKKGTSLSATFTASAGIDAELGGVDLLGSVLGAVFSGANPAQSGISAADAAALKGVLQDSLDCSLSIALNLACSAARTDEAAVLYAIDLLGGDADKTDAAIAEALRGDWTRLDGLPNAQAIRHVVKDTHKFQHKTTINLLGIYNAANVAAFVRSCTILHDGNGEVVITDKVSASRIATAQAPYAADPDKLRSALADAFLTTVTYSAAATGGLKPVISASQRYFLYDRKMARQKMTDAILLGRQLGLLEPEDAARILAATPSFGHARVSVNADYEGDDALRLFFADPAKRVARSQADWERIGRSIMLALIDVGDDAAKIRRSVLADDRIWAAMDDKAAVTGFGFIPGLDGLSPTELGAVAADWIGVRWWADAMVKIGGPLALLLSAIESSPAADPTTSQEFMKNRDKLAMVLGAVTRSAHAAFVGGWGLAVMVAASGSAAALTMDITSDAGAFHFEKPSSKVPQIARMSQ